MTHLMSMRIFTTRMNKIIKRAPKIVRGLDSDVLSPSRLVLIAGFHVLQEVRGVGGKVTI
jgi:hypothetical protein